MPPSSQSGRPKLAKKSSSQQSGNANIRDFLKPKSTIPRNRIPLNDVVGEEIVDVLSPKKEETGWGKGVGSGSASGRSSTVKSLRREGSGSEGVLTPRKSGRRLPVKSTPRPPLQLDGAVDDDDHEDTLHECPPSSQQRVLTAVEIPSSRKRKPSPPSPAQPEPSKMENTNVSFNSTSSLTSIPISSQASSSRRIVKDGVPLVTNSDSGSAEESEDELQDIVIPRKKMRMTPPPAVEDEMSTSTVKPQTRQSGRLSEKKTKSLGSSRSRTPRSTRRSPSPPARPVNISALLKLVREKEKREKADAKIREAETAFEAEQKAWEERFQRERERNLDGGLKVLVAEDSDEGERMMLAVERTEAMGMGEREWFYFRGVRDDLDVDVLKREDVEAFDSWKGEGFKRLRGMVVDERAREQACLSGFLAEVAGRYGVPPELADWMLRQLAMETREDLCEAYVEILRRALPRGGLDVDEMHECERLSEIYWTADDADDKARSRRKEQGIHDTGNPPPGLRHIVRVIATACTCSPSFTSARPLTELTLASLDAHVGRGADLQAQLQESMAAIVEVISQRALASFARAIWSLASNLSLPLRCRFVGAIPAYTTQCHRLRRMLALHLLDNPFEPVPALREPWIEPEADEWVAILLNRLRTAPEWSISESTDYALLNALIPVLDIAIDAGFSSPFRTTTSLPSHPTHPSLPTKPSSNSFTKPLRNTNTSYPTQSTSTKAFNARIDALTSTLRLLSSRIRDAGTSHLRRTEAKSALERVVVRLEWCVRTKPRAVRGVFGGGGRDEEEERERGFMGGFLMRGKEDGGGDEVSEGQMGGETEGKEEDESSADGDGDVGGGAERL